MLDFSEHVDADAASELASLLMHAASPELLGVTAHLA